MPRNTTGGSGHKAQRNSEGSKARNNRCLVDDLIDDLRNGEDTKGVNVGRVLKRMGCGRMEVFYLEEVLEEKKRDDWLTDADSKAAKKKEFRVVQQIMPMRGGLRGKGKRSVWVDLDSIVMIAETGLAGTTHEIVAVFSPEHVAKLRKYAPDTDDRIFLKNSTESAPGEAGFEFEEPEKDDIDVDDI